MKVNTSTIQPNIADGLSKGDRVSRSNEEKNIGASKLPKSVLDASAKVNISDRGKELQRVKDLATQAPDVDAEKVAKFRSLIEKGEYNVNAGALADRILEDELMLAAAQD